METKDILQVNAIIIAGAFIFLSLSLILLEEPERSPINSTDTINGTKEKLSLSETIFRYNTHSFVAFLVIIPFTMSSIVAIEAHCERSRPPVYGIA